MPPRRCEGSTSDEEYQTNKDELRNILDQVDTLRSLPPCREILTSGLYCKWSSLFGWLSQVDKTDG